MYSGMSWKVISCLFFAIENGLIRYFVGSKNEVSIINTSLSLNSILFFQNLFAAIMLLWLLKDLKLNCIFPKPSRSLYIYRGFTFVLATYAWVLSLKFATVTQVVVLGSIASCIITFIGSALWLKEKVNFYRILGVLFSLFIAYLIIPPERKYQLIANELLGWSVLLPFASMLGYALVKFLTKKISINYIDQNSALILSLHFFLFMVPFNLLMAQFDIQMPNSQELILLLFLSLVTVIGHVALVKALYYADLIVLIPINKIKFVFSAIIDFLFFNEYPKLSL
jgi:drug/metabolite transporter (DMT)-like permease